ncbi:MAG: T9SS type A sorting domain-containing protein [Bacteroidales bacterium]
MALSKLQNILLASAFVAGGAIATNQMQAQTVNDTIWGEVVTNVSSIENSTPIENAELLFTPLQMQGDTIPDTTYQFFTNNAGTELVKVPIYIDLETGRTDQEKKSIDEFLVYPNPSSDFNIRTFGKPLTNLKVINIQGQVVKEKKLNYDNANNYSTAYVNLSNLPTGTYILNANGVSKKIIKTNTPTVGEKTTTNIKAVHKSTNNWEATYKLIINAEGYNSLDTIIVLEDGFNGQMPFQLTPPPGTPQYQFIAGNVIDENDNPIEGATVWIKEQGTNNLLGETSSLANGSYILPDSLLPGTQFYFGVGGIEGKFSFQGDVGEVPIQITNLADTLKAVYKFILPNKVHEVE